MRARFGEGRDETLRQRDGRPPLPSEAFDLHALARREILARRERGQQIAEPVAGQELVPQRTEHGELRGAVLGGAARPIRLLVPLEQMNDAVEIAHSVHGRAQLLRGEIRLHGRARRALEILGPIADEHGRETAALRDVDDLLLRDARDDAEAVVRRRKTHDGVERLLVRAALLVEHGE